MKGVARLGGTTWLAAAVAVILPAIAWLQFDWASQLATADRERRERTLRAAGAQFTSAVDAEIGRLGGSLQLDDAMVERKDWDAYALRYDSAVDDGVGAVVAGVWFAEVSEGAAPDRQVQLHQWQPEARTFTPVEWPAMLDGVRTQLLTIPEAPGGRPPRSPRDVFAAMGGIGDERTLVMPIVRVQVQVPRESDATPDRILRGVRMRGFTIVRLDTDALARARLPELAAEHFPADAGYRVAVVGTSDGRVLFESSPGAAAATASATDLTTPFMHARMGPMMVFARVTARDGAVESRVERMPPPPDLEGPDAERRIVSMIEMRERDGERGLRSRGGPRQHTGYWTLRVQHTAGSLQAAVEAARRRNLLLSGGVLALLGVVVGLIAVSARRAQALARQQMEFVAAVSHELRTPVAVINTAAGNLADGVVSEPGRVKRYGETIQTEARRLGETVERVLQLAGLGSGQPLPMSALSAGALVREAVQRTAGDAARAGVDVQVEIAPDLPDVLGDAGTLHSAVQNLVGNAVKYAGDDRWVRVSVTAATTPAREVRIAVEDHGAGLDAEERRRVFEPFYRGKAAIANQIQGSGLGLSLVKRIADAHAGRVEVTSELGRGSTFTISLPAAPDTPAAVAARSQTATHPAAPTAG